MANKRFRNLSLLMILSVMFSLGACSSQGKPAESQSSLVSESVSVTELQESSKVTEEKSSAEVSQVSAEPEVLPAGVYRSRNGFLKYTDRHSIFTVTFPDSFHVQNTEYQPVNGIYLQNQAGTATLALEYIEKKDVTNQDLIHYLKTTYPDAEVHINDDRFVICKNSLQDRDGHTLSTLLKARASEDGYKMAVLYFHPADQNNYEGVFNKITFT